MAPEETGDAAFPATLSLLMGLVAHASRQNYAQTCGTLLMSLERRKLPLLGRIDHGAGARSAGLSLPPTEVFLFGHAALGTPLMIDAGAIAIDLPLKLLVSEDAEGQCWLTFNDPSWIARRHNIVPSAYPALKVMRDLLDALCAEAGSAP